MISYKVFVEKSKVHIRQPKLYCSVIIEKDGLTRLQIQTVSKLLPCVILSAMHYVSCDIIVEKCRDTHKER